MVFIIPDDYRPNQEYAIILDHDDGISPIIIDNTYIYIYSEIDHAIAYNSFYPFRIGHRKIVMTTSGEVVKVNRDSGLNPIVLNGAFAGEVRMSTSNHSPRPQDRRHAHNSNHASGGEDDATMRLKFYSFD